MKRLICVMSMCGLLITPLVYAQTAGNGGNFTGGQAANTVEGMPHKSWGHRHHHGKGDFWKRLNLTDDQKKQMEDLKAKKREAMKSVFGQIKASKEALDAELLQATPDMNKINSLQAQLKAGHDQMTDAHLNNLLEIKKILTPVQFGMFMEHNHKGGPMGYRHGHGPKHHVE